MKQGEGKKLLLGLIAVFILFQWVASALGSMRGEAGILVGLIVVIATIKVERLLFTSPVGRAVRAIGLALPERRGLIAASVIACVMLASVILFAGLTRSTISLYPNWQWLMIGLFFQAGLGEETLFRGYLFGHLRQRHTFSKAVFFAAIPFVLVHAILFYSLPWSLAGASILLSIAMSFPFSKLFEMGGDSVVPPAIVHFAAQAMAKLFVVEGESAWLFPFFCISISAVVPLAVYVVPLIVRNFGRKGRLTPAVAGVLVVLVGGTYGQETQAPDWSANIPACKAARGVKRKHTHTFSRRSDAHAGKDACAPIASEAVTGPNERQQEFDSDIWSRKELTGDRDGRRTELRENGIDLRFRLTQIYQVASDRKGEYSGKLDTHFRIDFEKLSGWKGLSMQIKTETRFGRIVSADNALPVNAAVLSPKSSETAFAITALNVTQVIPLDKEKGNAIAIGAGKYYSLDASRDPFTGGGGVTRFMNIMANGNPAVGQTVPIVSNGATFAWIRKGTPVVSFAVFDPVASSTKIGVRKLFKRGVTFVPGVSIPTSIAGRSGRHTFSGTVTTREFTPFDQLAQFVVPGEPKVPVVPKSGSWSATYAFNQYVVERTESDGSKTGWGLFGTITAADDTTNPVSRFIVVGVGGTGLFRSRRRDSFGAAYAFAGVSGKLKTVIDPVLRVRNEQVGEAFYNFSLTPWMSLTADLQVIRPVLRSAAIAAVPGLRLVTVF